jgi:hypothetical protein
MKRADNRKTVIMDRDLDVMAVLVVPEEEVLAVAALAVAAEVRVFKVFN